MYPNSMIFGIAFAALFGIVMLVGTLIGMKRGLFPTLIRFGMMLLSFVIAIPLTNAVNSILSGYVPDIMHSLLGNTADQIAQNSPSTMELISQFPLALIAPILFIAIFYLLKSVTLIVFRFVKHLFPKNKSPLFRTLAGVSGALASLISLLAVCLPLWGLLGICRQTVQTVTEIEVSQNEDLRETIVQIDAIDNAILAPAVHNFTTELFTNGGNNFLYNHITKLRLHGESIYLGEELHLVTETVADILTLAGSLPENFSLADLSEEQIADLREISKDIDHSALLKNICAEWASSMAQAWMNNESFMGIEDPANNTKIKPILHSLYRLLATTNVDLLVSDINLFVDILDVLVRHELLIAQQTALLERFGSDAFINDLTAPLSEHDRIRATLSELTASTTSAWASGADYMGLAEPQMNTE